MKTRLLTGNLGNTTGGTREGDCVLFDCLMIVVVVLLFYVHGKQLRSYRDGQLT